MHDIHVEHSFSISLTEDIHMEQGFSISLTEDIHMEQGFYKVETGFSHINRDPDHLMGFRGTPVYSLPTNSNRFVKSL